MVLKSNIMIQILGQLLIFFKTLNVKRFVVSLINKFHFIEIWLLFSELLIKVWRNLLEFNFIQNLKICLIYTFPLHTFKLKYVYSTNFAKTILWETEVVHFGLLRGPRSRDTLKTDCTRMEQNIAMICIYCNSLQTNWFCNV